jgi:hypothetical protein
MQSSCLLKLIEMQLLDVFDEKLCLNNKQFGFLKGTSTSDACFVLKESVYRYTKNKSADCCAAFVDLSQAFDSVNHFKLGNILLDRGIPPDLVLFLMHYLRNQLARVIWNKREGDYHLIDCGVRQGGVISPFLFKVYIDSVLESIDSSPGGCRFGLNSINVIGYADDIVLLARSQSHLNTLYSLLKRKLIPLELRLNPIKTKCLFFGPFRKVITRPQTVLLDNDHLEVVNKFKYLGHWIDCDLSDVSDIEANLNRFYAKFNSIYREFKTLNLHTLIYLFKSHCIPDFGIGLWTSRTASTFFRAFEVAYSNALKRMIGAPRYASSHISAGRCELLLLRHQVMLSQSRFFYRIRNINNAIISLNQPFFSNGFTFSYIHSHFKDKYSAELIGSSLDIVESRIKWVQRNEPQTTQCYYFDSLV